MSANRMTLNERLMYSTVRIHGRGEAGEVMTIVQLAMTAGLPYTALRDAILVHPTMAEGLARLFRALPARP